MNEKLTAVPREFVSTLDSIPGYEITSHLGAIGTVSSTFGKGATNKGFESLQTSLHSLRTAAWERGANAIVGLHASPYGAKAYGPASGDAVGVLLLGTAVTIELIE